MSETKIYWQAMDADGGEYLHGCKPVLINSERWDGDDKVSLLIFPIKLKPLQLAKITITPDGKWHAEIETEREEGYYVAKFKDGDKTVLRYKDGTWEWFNDGVTIEPLDIEDLTVSSTRIPDECII